MGCKGICIRYKTKARFTEPHTKKCTKCHEFIKWEGKRCPCCGQMLSTIPNTSRYRSKLRERKGIGKRIE